MSDSLILNLVLFLPLLGIGCLTQVPTDRPQVTRQLTLWMMIAQLALTAWLYFQFDGSTAAFAERHTVFADLQLHQEQLGAFLHRVLHQRDRDGEFAYAGRDTLRARTDAGEIRARFRRVGAQIPGERNFALQRTRTTNVETHVALTFGRDVAVLLELDGHRTG